VLEVGGDGARDGVVRHEDDALARDDAAEARHDARVEDQRALMPQHLPDAVQRVLVLGRVQALHPRLDHVERCRGVHRLGVSQLRTKRTPWAAIASGRTVVAKGAEDAGGHASDQAQTRLLRARHVLRVVDEPALLEHLGRHALPELAIPEEPQSLVARLISTGSRR